jgi:hypothetical protein
MGQRGRSTIQTRQKQGGGDDRQMVRDAPGGLATYTVGVMPATAPEEAVAQAAPEPLPAIGDSASSLVTANNVDPSLAATAGAE